MWELKSPHELFGQDDAELALEVFTELAVLAAIGDEQATGMLDEAVTELSSDSSPLAPHHAGRVQQFSQMLAANSLEWRERMIYLAKQVPDSRRRMWLAHSCLSSRFLPAEMLNGDVVMRRLDAVLDLANVPFCAFDVQVSLIGLAEDLAAAKVSTSMKVGAGAAAATAAFVATALGHFGAWVQAGHGMDYVLTRLGKAEPLAEQTARLVVAAQAAADPDGRPSTDAADIWRYLYEEVVTINRELGRLRSLPDGPGELTKQSRIVEAAEQDLRQLVGDDYGFVSMQPIPDTRGMSLLSANHVLDAIGVQVDTVDDTGQKRWQVNTEAWRVTKQAATGRSVLLSVLKFSE